MKKHGGRYFTPDEYRRFARNPFVDKKTLQLIKNKTVGQSGMSTVAGTPSSGNAAASGGPAPRRHGPISEEAALRIAMSIRTMLRE